VQYAKSFFFALLFVKFLHFLEEVFVLKIKLRVG